jgi:hypothetical protein
MFLSGCLCVDGMAHGAVVAFLWDRIGSIPQIELTLTPPPHPPPHPPTLRHTETS